jgi:hypothetical protein
LDEKNWKYLQSTPSVKLIHNSDSETFEIYFVEDLEKTVKERNINPMQLDIIVMDENHKTFLEKHLHERDVFGVNVSVNNYLFNTVKIPNERLPITHKFSSLSRNYRVWRLYVYVELAKRKLLDNFNYSFHNIHPYNDPPKIIPLEIMIEDLSALGINELPSHVNQWLNSCPHELSISNEVQNKWSNVTYDTIISTDFHLIIETHFDQKEYVVGNNLYDRNFAPTSITEKGYKPIACQTPFIVFSTPFYLTDLRKLGFKTYSPFINEAYDTETDSGKRLNMIVDEIERICNLNSSDYRELVNNCKIIAKENLDFLKTKQNA